MERLRIVTVADPIDGRLTGWLKDKPGVVVQGDDYSEVVQNIIKAKEMFEEVEAEIAKEEN